MRISIQTKPRPFFFITNPLATSFSLSLGSKSGVQIGGRSCGQNLTPTPAIPQSIPTGADDCTNIGCCTQSSGPSINVVSVYCPEN
ncbi:hypothetical protein TUN199_11029 [Pyrenophora tritici-repentis]|nr:hypothetical protein Alg130_10614 [Pyrenophora tritici-repentis]KAI0605145.1 hypothetical protein TUN205_10605 [Pyrenophora tritici-repentis]KAI0616978.1 hypothetical protein TUN199_11029 [Pyrenophora tritici-repentis]